VFDKKLPARGRHEPVPDPLLSPFVRNVSLFPNSSGIQPGEGFSSSASDISNGKGYDPSFRMYFVCLYKVNKSLRK